MGRELIYIGCGISLGIGLVLLLLAYISSRYGDDSARGCLPLVIFFFLLALVILVRVNGF